MEPASIRYKNPGAMWGSALAIKWGASPKAVSLNDGTGQGNNIAVFPTFVQGICAQLDLWRTSKHYANKTFGEAIAKWSGGNHVSSYINFVKARVPGIQTTTVMDDAFWRGPMAIPFLKAQAWHEAGKPYPAPEADWIEARRRVLGIKPAVTKKDVVVAAATTTIVGTVSAGVHQGWALGQWFVAIAVLLAAAGVGYLVWRWMKARKAEPEPVVEDEETHSAEAVAAIAEDPIAAEPPVALDPLDPMPLAEPQKAQEANTGDSGSSSTVTVQMRSTPPAAPAKRAPRKRVKVKAKATAKKRKPDGRKRKAA